MFGNLTLILTLILTKHLKRNSNSNPSLCPNTNNVINTRTNLTSTPSLILTLFSILTLTISGISKTWGELDVDLRKRRGIGDAFALPSAKVSCRVGVRLRLRPSLRSG